MILSLYESLESPERLEVFLERAAELFDCGRAQIIHQNVKNAHLSFSALYGYDWSPEDFQTYAELMPDDPRLEQFLGNPWQARHCRMGISDETYHNSRVYKELLRRENVEYTLGLSFGQGAAFLSGMFLVRDRTQPCFNDEDCAKLQSLVPHLKQVFRLQEYVGRLEQENNVMHSTLDALSAGVVVVDGTGHVDFANRAAKSLLANHDGIEQMDGNLEFVTRNGANLSDVLENVRTSQSMHPCEIPRRSGEPLLAFSAPLVVEQERFKLHAADKGGTVVILRNSYEAIDIDSHAQVLELMWKLTPKQARLACFLGDGKTLTEAADEMEITADSARQYLKTIFTKLGVSRQSDLIRKVMRVLVSNGRAS